MGFNGPLRIPFSEIHAWCELKAYSFQKRQEFLRYITPMDDAHMAFFQKQREKMEQEEKAKAAKQKR